METCLYRGTVTHVRRRPFGHRFAYRVFSALFDLDAISEQASKSRLFSHNRWNVLSFFDRDHGARDGSPPRAWIDTRLRDAGYDPSGWRIWLHCFPRLFGYGFNPLSIYFCCDPAGRLRIVLYDVRNTFGDKHGYLIPVAEPADGPIRQSCAKGFHVSPFLPPQGRYAFTLHPPGERYTLRIALSDADGDLLIATQHGKREPFSDRLIVNLIFTHPLMTLKVIAAIHWQALWIWRKGAAFSPRPVPPPQDISIVPSDQLS